MRGAIVVHAGSGGRGSGPFCAIIFTGDPSVPVAFDGPAISIFLLKRFATFVATLVAASVVIFAVLDILPGNAAEVMLGDSATPESVAALSAKLGLDRPALVRYADWMKGLATGELGNSVSYDTPIAQLIGERLAVTVPLALMAMVLTTVLALALGLFAASHHNRPGDVGVMAASQIGIAIPNFWFAILLILLFAVKLQMVLGRRLSRLGRRRSGRRSRRWCCRPSRSRWCRPRSSRASRARRCSTCCAKTSCAPRAPRA